MIERFYTTVFTVSRMAWSADSAGLDEVGTFSGHLQQARPEIVQQLGLAMTKTFSVWCAVSADVQEGDTLEVQSTATFYKVRAVQINNYGTNSHKELIVEKT